MSFENGTEVCRKKSVQEDPSGSQAVRETNDPKAKCYTHRGTMQKGMDNERDKLC